MSEELRGIYKYRGRNEHTREALEDIIEKLFGRLSELENDPALDVPLDVEYPAKFIGIGSERLNENNPREVIFWKLWRDKNLWGNGIHNPNAQLLNCLLEPYPDYKERAKRGMETFPSFIYPSKRDWEVAATLMQWLGSNIGQCFIIEGLEKCGYTIKKQK